MFRCIKLIHQLNSSEGKIFLIRLVILTTAKMIGISCTLCLTCTPDSICRDSLFVLDTTKLLIAYAVWYTWSRNQWNEATAVTGVLIITYLCTDMALHSFIELCNKCRSRNDGKICMLRAFMTVIVDYHSETNKNITPNNRNHSSHRCEYSKCHVISRDLIYWENCLWLTIGNQSFDSHRNV